jgi:exosortase
MSGYNVRVTTQARSDGQGGAASSDEGAPRATPDGYAQTARQVLTQIPPTLHRLWHAERHWLLVVIPLLLTLIGPAKWFKIAWEDPNGPLAFQPFVPLGVLYLFWANQDVFQALQREREVTTPVGSRRRYGTILVAVIGCVFLFFSYLTMLTTLAMIGFIVTLAGLLLCLYGKIVFPAFVRPLVFLMTMVPFPGSLISQATAFLQLGCARVAGTALSLIYPSTRVYGNFIVMDHYTAQVSGPCSGVGILLPVMVLTLLLVLVRRVKIGIAALILAAGLVVSLVMNTVRIVFMGMIGSTNVHWAESLHDANSWIFTALAFYITFLIAGKIGPRRARRNKD